MSKIRCVLRYKDSTIVSEIYFTNHYYYLAYFLLSLLQLTANCVVRLMVSIYSMRGYRRRLFAEAIQKLESIVGRSVKLYRAGMRMKVFFNLERAYSYTVTKMNVVISDKTEALFRETVARHIGMKKEDISKALEQARRICN